MLHADRILENIGSFRQVIDEEMARGVAGRFIIAEAVLVAVS